jgi:membrane-bound metal-dependent hydrolase YbcI (DUF457 family)
LGSGLFVGTYYAGPPDGLHRASTQQLLIVFFRSAKKADRYPGVFMPFPIGHTAIGLAAFETAQPQQERSPRWVDVIFVALLANLPDVDIMFGLVLRGDGAAYHRGPTHSLLFAVLCGYLASRAWRLRAGIPKVSFGLCTLLILSHVLADMLLTTAPVSLLWPLEIHWAQGHSSWLEVVDMVLFQSVADIGIVVAVFMYFTVVRAVRAVVRGGSLPAKRN